MKKNRPRPTRTSHKSMALLLSILLVAVILGSFSLMQVNKNPQQVEGIMNTNTQGLDNVFPLTGTPPVIHSRPDPRLTCDQCARIAMWKNGIGALSSLCLNTANSTGAYAHCATGSITGETCVTCPTVTPLPTYTPVPTGCHWIHNNCPYIYCRPSSLNGTPNACPTCTPSWKYVCDGIRQPAAPLGQNTPVNETTHSYNFFQNIFHAIVGGNSNSTANGN